MPIFKQKNVIKSYKLRLQEKLKTITEETENATSFLNNRVLEFQDRVQHILAIKDEKCLSLYRKLIKDLESYSEKLFILQASIEEVTEEESDSSEDENASIQSSTQQLKTVADAQSRAETPCVVSSCAEIQDEMPSVVSSCAEVPPDENSKLSCKDDDGSSFTEEDFCSLHSENFHAVKSTVLNSQVDNRYTEQISSHDNESNINASLSSCYRSISSNFSEAFSCHTDSKSIQSVENCSLESKHEQSLETSGATLKIQSAIVDVPSHFSATISSITDPSNFWMQIENSHRSNIIFSKSEYSHSNKLSFVKEGSYCLAPFKSTSFYYRAQALSNAKSGKDFVKILFVDHGSTQDIPLCDLKTLPVTAYSVPVQAIHCYLYGIVPKNGSWSQESIERFRDFQNCCIETFVKSKENSYGVELVAKLAADLDEDFSVDIAQALCLDGLAVSVNESLSLNINQDQGYESHLLNPTCSKADSSLEVSGSYDANAISSDSGVSVTSAYKSSQISKRKEAIFTKVSRDCYSSVPVNNSSLSQFDTNLIGFNLDSQMKDLISFDSYDGLENVRISNKDLKATDRVFTSGCLVCRKGDFCFHLKIPSPSLVFVEKDMMIVMLSHIVNPHEFYVNMAMENIVSLDELREQMTNTYETQQNLCAVNIEDLSENMYCAARFTEDNYWYRFKILRISSEDKEKNEIWGQYVDYGNVAEIKCCNLQPLKPEFSQHPIFAIKCSLAGVSPLDSKTFWTEEAISAFKELISFERCLTAQICSNPHDDQSDTHHVLLWDTEDSQDLLVNLSLADQKVATFDFALIDPSLSNHTAAKPQLDIEAWDPMLEEYCDTQNSYGHDDEDLEIVTTGYQAQDEKYTCKYFSLRGWCPRGSNCSYQHLPLLETGVTRDQEEVFCMDTSPIISDGVCNILVQVSAIVNPGHFYVVLPLGCRTIDEIDALVYNGASYNEIINSEAKALFYNMDKHYSKASFQENTSIALSCGTIVAAKRKWDEKWHRGRIIDVAGINKPAKVFFVDSGDQEWVPRKFIHSIVPKFLHTPFQAVQCCLQEVEPIPSDGGLSWSSDSVNFFKNIVTGQMLLAETVQRFGQLFYVSLRRTTKDDHRSVAELLISAGYAQNVQFIPTDKKTIYVPG